MKRRHIDPTAWHVVMRGARRLLLFRDDADRAAFLRYVSEGLAKGGVTLHAWVLMGNHYHLLASGGGKDLSAFLQQVNRRFSRGNNAKYDLKGHLYEGPYLAFPVWTDFWLFRTSRYIDFNPVRAGLARRPEDYRWSSCRAIARGDASPVKIDARPVLDAAGGREAYRAFEPPPPGHKPGKSPKAADIWMEHVAWLVAHALERKDALEGESPQTVAVAWARQAGVPPRIIARALGYSNGHSVSVLLDSLRKRAEDQPHLRKVMDMIK